MPKNITSDTHTAGSNRIAPELLSIEVPSRDSPLYEYTTPLSTMTNMSTTPTCAYAMPCVPPKSAAISTSTPIPVATVELAHTQLDPYHAPRLNRYWDHEQHYGSYGGHSAYSTQTP